jgi:PqqD family protein of HPr-rel-A system
MWRITPGQTLRFRQFDDEIVLYNDLSGDTHLLGGSAMHLLSVLQHGPAARQALHDSLAVALECGRDPDFDADADALLDRLAGFFLIQPVPC